MAIAPTRRRLKLTQDKLALYSPSNVLEAFCINLGDNSLSLAPERRQLSRRHELVTDDI